MYIGIGTVVLIVIIVLVILMLRRAYAAQMRLRAYLLHEKRTMTAAVTRTVLGTQNLACRSRR